MILAHGIGGRSDLPIPLTVLILGAGGVLVVTFLALGLMWKTPRLQGGPDYQRPGAAVRTSGVLGVIGVISLLLVLGQVVVPLVGVEREAIRPTIAPVMVWVVFWLVVPFAGSLIGDWYTDLNPWRAIARAARVGRAERVGVLDSVGLWPASGLFVAFAWFELVYPRSGDPTMLGVAALV
ncbi:MAG TPA: hypothetical protein VFT85_03945, partial [Acidimicrobiia bacterium]|nr:hypothetical protein [Acidimicrobiia bacterium]